MFNCTVCGKTTAPREPMHRRVVETRPKVYLNSRSFFERSSGSEAAKSYGEVAGVGTEIVREEQHCVACAKSPEGEGVKL